MLQAQDPVRVSVCVCVWLAGWLAVLEQQLGLQQLSNLLPRAVLSLHRVRENCDGTLSKHCSVAGRAQHQILPSQPCFKYVLCLAGPHQLDTIQTQSRIS